VSVSRAGQGVIRTYGGESLYERIEAIRAASVDRFRGIANLRGIATGLETLSLDEAVAFVRCFTLFSMLANLAEDRQGGKGETEDTLASVLGRLRPQGITAREVGCSWGLVEQRANSGT
jgi:phosphoenolpyruvate carboxylase